MQEQTKKTEDTQHPIRVLFVDDEEQLLLGLKVGLRKQPYEIHTAISSEEALDILAKTPIDVVVSDESMPGMSGSKLLGIVRKIHPDTVRIIFSGHASMESILRAINDGEVYRYILKPVELSDLVTTINQGFQFLSLARRSSKLLDKFQEQQALLEELERRHPGITKINDEKPVQEEPKQRKSALDENWIEMLLRELDDDENDRIPISS